MTVKEKKGRRRYLYFETAGGTPAMQEELFQAILLPASRQGLTTIKLIQFNGKKGIIRCNLNESERLREIVNSQPPGAVKFISLCTSGTILTLRERYFPETVREKRSKNKTG